MTKTSPPHILLANVFFAPFSYGGATIVAEQVARSLVAHHGVRVSVVSTCQRGDLIPYHIIKSEVGGITNYLINLPPGRAYAQIYDNPQVTEIIARVMDQVQPDLLHAHCVQDMGVGLFQMAKDRGIPSVLSVHDFWWLCDRQFMIRPNQSYCGQFPIKVDNCKGCVEDFSAAKTRFQHLARVGDLVDLITYPSEFARGLSEASGFGLGKSVVWENGVQAPGPGFFDRQAARRAKDPRISFGFLGGPSQIKGWPLLRRAFSQLNRDAFKGYLVDASLDASWWGPGHLKGLKGDWAIHPRFNQDQMDGFYEKVDVVLFLSQWKETFGLAIREALVRGIDVIQTDSGGTTEHPRAEDQVLIPIGSGPDPVLAAVRGALDAGLAGVPDPVDVTSFDDQAARFLTQALPLIQGPPNRRPTQKGRRKRS